MAEYRKTRESIAALTLEQYRVTQENGTERPFQNAFWNNHERGLYVDVVLGEPLFTSTHKFNSQSGWPSFTQPTDPEHIVGKIGETLGMRQTEVRSKAGDSHLGHSFTDGPKEAGGLRYCINSSALRFVPVTELDTEGYGRYRHLFVEHGRRG
jgi:methionine-R-sulfoxide reductase